MNIVKRISAHRALRADVQAWCADTRERLIIRKQDPRTIPDPPSGYRKFPEAVELENERMKALRKVESAEREAAGVAAEKLRRARITEPEHEQYLALCQILPSEIELLSHVNQQWLKARLRELATERTTPPPS